ncbi:dUTP diphosphatase [archaeon]|jgi:dUTP pyrophosphatase|nr:dUTP diphosphatase [archaeon]MBT6823930.1 dUTP diphosphatase [archaeon]MBT7107160.1 dUTP diphosphatase [archaeon]MBT7297770.1 dUTP diphosphatase [archaeon]
MKIERLDKEIMLPTYAHENDAGFDLRSAENSVLKPGERRTIKTGIKLAVPEDMVGLIWDRSGHAHNNGLHVLAGVIDSGYRGEVGVVLKNLGDSEFIVEKNMRIAQMLVQPIHRVKIEECENLGETVRNSSGFGSTGNK